MADLDDMKTKEFGRELAALINKYGLDTAFNTPDWIVAQYMMWAANALNRTVFLRDGWFGRFNKVPATEGEAGNG